MKHYKNIHTFQILKIQPYANAANKENSMTVVNTLLIVKMHQKTVRSMNINKMSPLQTTRKWI